MTNLTPPVRTFFQVLFLLAAIDSVVVGTWAVLCPTDLLPPVEVQPPDEPRKPRDDIFLWRATGALAIAQAVILGMLVWRPESFGPLAIVPLLGRCLTTAVWLWLLGSDRDTVGDGLLTVLAIHDAGWIPLFASFLLVWHGSRR